LIPPGASVADVGTDHGKLAVWLALDARCPRITATDISPLALHRGQEFAERRGVPDRVDFLCCDGLEGLTPDAARTVVIAGIGGENIAGILARSPLERDAARTYILQPASRENVLRAYLSENGYCIGDERLTLDGGRIYATMLVRHGDMPPLHPAQLYAGVNLHKTGGALFGSLLDKLIARFQKDCAKLAETQGGSAELKARLGEYETVLAGLLRMKEGVFKNDGT